MEFPTTTLALITIIAVSELIGVVAIDNYYSASRCRSKWMPVSSSTLQVSQKRWS